LVDDCYVCDYVILCLLSKTHHTASIK